MSTDPTAEVWELASNVASPLLSAVSDNLGVLLPVGIALMAILLGVSLIPRIIYKFF